ncbi:hypothetical protein [Streptomyces sp. NBC_00620]|uniref:hypothetical protein n=1 Tax=Streptomyces sp. NBC_00620 TaxID=2903666 RepID=UPI00224E153E|nr:hypothetical protein [Streptomyces sp. NBC_00620]MCX4972185.1 hypothetical protein [Streptomyces sp. NBC_00620]
MTIPQPMPHPNEDADHLAARASKQTFVAKARAVRENLGISDRLKTQQVSDLYDTHVQETADAYERLTTRRRDRLAYLESLVPVGAGIAEDATPADKAVLMTAFRTAWKEAQEVDRAGRMRMLAEAERFGDDAARRAVLTFAVDHGEMETVRAWTDLHLDEKGMVDEARTLRETLAGRGPLHGFEWKDFTPVPKAREAYDWPRIKDHPEAQPSDPGREVRPGVIEFGRRR